MALRTATVGADAGWKITRPSRSCMKTPKRASFRIPIAACRGALRVVDALFLIRSNKSVIVVDPSVDDVRDVARDARRARRQWTKPYYFGLELERVRSHIEREYRIVPVLVDPLLWRFDRIEGTD